MEEILSEMKSLRAAVETLSAEVSQLKKSPTHGQVYSFREEPTEELPAKVRVRHLLSRPNDCIPGLLRLVLQNPKTRNIHMPNLRGEYIALWNNEWKPETSKSALVKIVEHMLTLLNGHYQAGMHRLYARWMANSMIDMTADVEKVTDRVWKEQMRKCKAVLVDFRKTVVKKRRNGDSSQSMAVQSRDELDHENGNESRHNKRMRNGENEVKVFSKDCTEENDIEEINEEVEEEEDEGDGEVSEYDDSSGANEHNEDENVCKYPRQPKPKEIHITRTTTTDEYELPPGTYVPFGDVYKDVYVPESELTRSVHKLGYPDTFLLTQINLSFKFHDGRWLLHANKGDSAFALFSSGECKLWRSSTRAWDVDDSISCHF